MVENSLTEESLDYDLRNWKLVVSDLPGLLKERRDYLRTDDSEAVVAEHESAFGAVKDYEGQLEPYQDELNKILAILPKDKMQGYCELKRREIREGVSSEVSGPLAKLRRGFDLAEKEAQPKLNILLSVMHECETALSLSRKHLKWVTSVAWKQGMSLPEEDQEKSQVAPHQQKNSRGAGRKPVDNVKRRRKVIFKNLNTTSLEEAKQLFNGHERRHKVYRLLDQAGVQMIDSENFGAYTKWTELIETGDDLLAKETILKDLGRSWNQLLEKYKTELILSD